MSTPQTGDVLIVNGLSIGAEFTVSIVNGTIEMTQDFTSAIILSFFGGNEKDDGRPDNDEGWWGNLLENEDQFKLVSQLQNLLRGLPATSANLILLNEAARLDLQWFLDTNIANDVEVTVTLIGVDRILVTGIVTAIGLEQSFSFVENWKASA